MFSVSRAILAIVGLHSRIPIFELKDAQGDASEGSCERRGSGSRRHHGEDVGYDILSSSLQEEPPTSSVSVHRLACEKALAYQPSVPAKTNKPELVELHKEAKQQIETLIDVSGQHKQLATREKARRIRLLAEEKERHRRELRKERQKHRRDLEAEETLHWKVSKELEQEISDLRHAGHELPEPAPEPAPKPAVVAEQQRSAAQLELDEQQRKIQESRIEALEGKLNKHAFSIHMKSYENRELQSKLRRAEARIKAVECENDVLREGPGLGMKRKHEVDPEDEDIYN
ncbi:hypothetical protein PG994_002754 [Apiospora phragmitis]|uniref:Uncharacterized protein n=1 Tax=Apiospora phragmitis TaxID=2905665 RepID=A0ABR1W617_9PEZI